MSSITVEDFFGDYSVKNVKTAESRNGCAVSCSVYRGKKLICEMSNAGVGDANRYARVDKDEFSALEAHIKTLPQYRSPGDGSLQDFNDEVFIESLVNRKQLEARLKRYAKGRKRIYGLLTDGETVVSFGYKAEVPERHIPAVRKYAEESGWKGLLLDMSPAELADLAAHIERLNALGTSKEMQALRQSK